MEPFSKSLLIYNVEDTKLRKIQSLCTAMEIGIRSVLPAQYLEPIGALADIPGINPVGRVYNGPPFSDEMMIFCGFTNESLSDFLKAYKTEGIPGIGLKATFTPYNVGWNSMELHAELKKEHEEMTKRGSAPQKK